MLHQWEEPCLVGEHGAGAVFFSGCNLRCKFCQNGVISQEGYGKPHHPRRLREIFEELVEQGAACLDLVTPTHFTDAVLEALGEERWPVPVVWNCGGYESVETLKRLEDRVQVYLPDLKYALTEPAKAYSGAADYQETAKAAILEMFRQTGPYRMENGQLKSGVLIRHLVLPGELENTKDVIDWVAETFRPGEVLFCPYEPVHAPAGGRGQAGPEGDKGGIPGGGNGTWRTAALPTASLRSAPPPRRNTPRISICRGFEKIGRTGQNLGGHNMKVKKLIIVLAPIGILFVVICAVVSLTRPYFPPRPKNTTLEFWICDDVSSVDWNGHDEITGWMGAREFLGKDYHMSTQGGKPNVRVSYLLTAWPDYADDGQYVTTIEITDPAVFVYGLTVESEPTEFERVMMSMGYKVELADNSIQRAVRDGFTFSICHGDTPKLVISAEVSNREEICF